MALKPKQLMTSIDVGFDNWQSTSDSEALLAETGKTRQQLLVDIMADDEVLSCREDIHASLLARDWQIWGEGINETVINKLYKMIKHHQATFAEIAVLAKWHGYSVAEYLYQYDEDNDLTISQVLNKDGELHKYTPKRDGTLVFNGVTEQIIDEEL